MDEFLLCSDSKDQLRKADQKITSYLDQARQLTIKHDKKILAPSFQGLPYLGFTLSACLIRMNRRNLKGFDEKVNKLEKLYLAGEIPGEHVKQSIQSMLAHWSIGNTTRLIQRFFLEKEPIEI